MVAEEKAKVPGEAGGQWTKKPGGLLLYLAIGFIVTFLIYYLINRDAIAAFAVSLIVAVVMTITHWLMGR